MADSWQNFLYKKHSAVALSQLKSGNSVKLLDVFIKKGRDGSKPVIQNVGSMVTLGSSESEETVNRLREGLASFESSGRGAADDKDLFKLERDQLDFKHTIKSKNSVKASLHILDGAGLDLHGDRHLACSMEDVSFACVDHRELKEIIQEELWKPDIEKLKRHKWPQTGGVFGSICGESVGELWVTYEILYAKKVAVESVHSNHGNVGASTNVLVPAGGPPVKATLGASAKREIESEFRVSDDTAKPFAFRVLHVLYNSTGELVEIEPHTRSNATLITRSNNGEQDIIAPQFHLGGLFLKPPGEKQGESNGEDLVCLEIVGSSPDDEED